MMQEINTQLQLTSKNSMFLSIINNKVKGQVIGPDNIRDVITTETGHLSSVVRDVIDEKVNRDFKIMEEAVELLKFYKQDPNFSCFDFDLYNLEYLPEGVEKYGNSYSNIEIGTPIPKLSELSSMEIKLSNILKKHNLRIDYDRSKRNTTELLISYEIPYGTKTYYIDKIPSISNDINYEQFENDIKDLKFMYNIKRIILTYTYRSK